MKHEISIIIPVLNEEKNIIPLTKKIIKSIKKLRYEIIFVDDNSKDETKKILSKLQNNYKFFNPIIRRKNRDLTQSCFDGIHKAKYQNILIMDGDLQHNPKYINPMFSLFKNNEVDIVIGSRELLSGKNKGLSELRRLVSIILIFSFRIFRIETSDPMSGFFLFKKKLYLKNKKFMFGRGFKILADLLISSRKVLKTKDLKIVFDRRYNSKSKMSYKVLLVLVQFYFTNLFKKTFLR
jgi:dolichol-phosphate mannosyltransferase